MVTSKDQFLPPHDPARTFLLEQFFVAFVAGAALATVWAFGHEDSTMYAHVRLPGVVTMMALMCLSVVPALVQAILSSIRVVAFTEALLAARRGGLAMLFGSSMATAAIAGAFYGQYMGRTIAFSTVATFSAIAFLRIQLARRSG